MRAARDISAQQVGQPANDNFHDLLFSDFNFAQLRSRLERLWEDLRIPHAERQYFTSQFLNAVTFFNWNMVQTELDVLLKHRENTIYVLRQIQTRESHVVQLYNLCERYDARFYRKDAVKLEIDRIVANIRQATIEVLHAIQNWKSGMTRSKPFEWKASNYLHKISTDIQFMNDTPLFSLLGTTTSGNPFIVGPRPLTALHDYVTAVIADEEAASEKTRQDRAKALLTKFGPTNDNSEGGVSPRKIQMKPRPKPTGVESDGLTDEVLESALALQRMLHAEKNKRDARFTLRGTQSWKRWLALVVCREYRIYRARQVLRQLRNEKYAALAIQCFWRVIRARRIAWGLKVRMWGVRRVQAWIKGMKARMDLRKSFYTAVRIQAWWRSILGTRNIVKLKRRSGHAIRVQTAFRRFHATKAFRKMCKAHYACITIQCCWRQHDARRVVNVYRSRRNAARGIQRCWRAKVLRHKSRASIKIQALIRKKLAQLYVADVRQLNNYVACIQRAWMAHSAVLTLTRLRDVYNAARAVQLMWAVHKARQRTIQERDQWHHLCYTHLEAVMLVHHHEMAQRIQRAWRCCMAKGQVEKKKKQLHMLQQKYFDDEIYTRAALIQEWYRRTSKVERLKRIFKQRLAVLHVEKVTQIHIWKKFLLKRWCTRKIVRWYREKCLLRRCDENKNLLKSREKQGDSHELRMEGALTIQTTVRVYLAKLYKDKVVQQRKFEDELIRRRHAVRAVQKWWRRYTTLNTAVMARKKQQDSAATRIQCVYRGHLDRRVLSKYRQRLQHTMDKAARRIQQFFKCCLQLRRGQGFATYWRN